MISENPKHEVNEDGREVFCGQIKYGEMWASKVSQREGVPTLWGDPSWDRRNVRIYCQFGCGALHHGWHPDIPEDRMAHKCSHCNHYPKGYWIRVAANAGAYNEPPKRKATARKRRLGKGGK